MDQSCLTDLAVMDRRVISTNGLQSLPSFGRPQHRAKRRQGSNVTGGDDLDEVSKGLNVRRQPDWRQPKRHNREDHE